MEHTILTLIMSSASTAGTTSMFANAITTTTTFASMTNQDYRRK